MRRLPACALAVLTACALVASLVFCLAGCSSSGGSGQGSAASATPQGSDSVSSVGALRGVSADDEVQLTLVPRVQKAAANALGTLPGAVVVIDPATGALLAVVSSSGDSAASANTADFQNAGKAAELHIPGSTFKTVTLAAALESGEASLDEEFPAPIELEFENGIISNYGSMGLGQQTLRLSYAQSINTVFAQLALRIGIDAVVEQAGLFGFGSDLMPDLELETSTVKDVADMTPYAQGWAGVGQAVSSKSGSLQGPLMTPVQGAAMAAAIENDGVLMQPYLVASVNGTPTPCAESPQVRAQVVSPSTAQQVAECMELVVTLGTGTRAAVPGVDVRGKTGTAETFTGPDDCWFIGFARQPNDQATDQPGSHATSQVDDQAARNAGECFAFAVLVEGTDSGNASHVAATLIRALYE